jgi:hypothetical protein
VAEKEKKEPKKSKRKVKNPSPWVHPVSILQLERKIEAAPTIGLAYSWKQREEERK